MRVIDRVKRARERGKKVIAIPEWLDENNEPTRLYFGPLTIGEVRSIRDKLKGDGKDPDKHPDEERMLLLIEKAELEDGTKAFTTGDEYELVRSAEWPIYNRLLAFMYAAGFPETGGDGFDATRKKSEPTAGSDNASPSESSSE